MLTWLYRKLGSFYPAAYLVAELQSAFFVTAGTLALLAAYYEPISDELLPVAAVAFGVTAVAVLLNLLRTYPLLRPVQRWIDGDRSPETSARAWSAAVGLPLQLIRRDMWIPLAVVVFPTITAAIAIVGLPVSAAVPLLFSALVAVGYGAILHYLALEIGMRPVLVDINRDLAPRLQADCAAIPLRVRLMAALPLINIITGFVVAALTSDHAGGPTIELDFTLAIIVATLLSFELTVLLTKSVLRPLADLQEATDAVREGNYDVKVPVTTGDELGELAASFNQMVAGLQERERIREAFGTYLDRDVAEYILSEGFSEDGVDVHVSVLFCDVVNFTEFAAQADARKVVACLNELFEEIVPVVARHGGHVDKFEGDGLLAVFGAPEPFTDHADRAVRCAIEMARRVNEEQRGGPFQIGVGISSGRVVAGSIGGAGRLNFSVIGDAVNVAARVESLTRETGDDVLLTEGAHQALQQPVELVSRGEHELKGIAEPLEAFVPAERIAALTAAAQAAGDGTAPRAVASSDGPASEADVAGARRRRDRRRLGARDFLRARK